MTFGMSRWWTRFTNPAPAESSIVEISSTRSLEAPTWWLCALSDVGGGRAGNEDAFRIVADARVWVVADGMGGQKSGATASRIAVDAVIEYVSAAHDDPEETTDARLRRGLSLAHERVLARSVADVSCRGMGSALIAGCVADDVLYVAHAGDTRAYLLRDGVFTRLTVDHSAAANHVLRGNMTWEEARTHPSRNRLRLAAGVNCAFEPDCVSAPLRGKDKVLLCSDGLWAMVPDTEMANVLRSDMSVLQMAQILANRALAAGGGDNVTLVLYEHCGSRSPSFG